jgi:hypothetical protein
MRACSGVMTSMMTPPCSVGAVGVAPDARLLGRALGHEPRGDGEGEARGVGGEDAGEFFFRL